MHRKLSLVIPAFLLLIPVLQAQGPPPQPGRGGGPVLQSLKTVPVPQPAGAEALIRDNAALVALGKALFWDAQAGSDGRTACATCHFHAGADHRLKNQIAPPAAGGASVTANLTLAASDFPFHQLSDPNNNRSEVIRDKRQVAGSAGVFHGSFFDVQPGSGTDSGAAISGSALSASGAQTRQVTSRNAPSVINAVFNVRNFWDGRASDVFTGATPFGDSDPGLNLLVYRNGQLAKESIRVQRASLASQAMGPPLNEVEMSFSGRTWAKLGKKMLSLAPLARQRVAVSDSVLGSMANADGFGLQPGFSYAALIRAAFAPTLWSAPGVVETGGSVVAGAASPRNTNEFSQMEWNFGVFWGLAIQAYESTLVSSDSRLDQFLEGNRQALSALEQQGMQEFLNGGSQCTQCHRGSEFTNAAFSAPQRQANPGNPGDAGFFRTGVSTIAEDAGLGGTDGIGNALFAANTNRAQGTFKSPGLRNVELTGPYFHDGGQATLEQVLDFYSRQGDFPNGGNLGPGIGRIRLNQQEKAAITAFLKALTDDRVKFERAPFDHPSLCVPNGHAEQSAGVLLFDESNAAFPLAALDQWALIPASGSEGNAIPLQTFDELLRGIGGDGSRAHALTEACEP